MKPHQGLGLAGSILLMLGVFLPVMTMPIMGGVDYFQNGKGDGVIVLILGVVSLTLAFTPAFRGMILTGLGALAVLIFSFVTLLQRLEDMRAQMSAKGGLGSKIAGAMADHVHIGFGWGVLLVGSLLVIVAAVLPVAKPAPKRRKRIRENRPRTAREPVGHPNATAIDALDDLME